MIRSKNVVHTTTMT